MDFRRMTSQSVLSVSEIDWDDIPEHTVREILRLGETYLDSTLKVAIAADQRATALMGIYGAVGVALLVSAATIGTRTQPDVSLIASLSVVSFLLLISGLICGRAGRPVDFYISGYEPKKIVKSSADDLWLLRYVCDDVQRRIDSNRQSLEKSSILILSSFIISGVSVVAGIAVFLLVRIMSLS
jgi:hypothetical protein